MLSKNKIRNNILLKRKELTQNDVDNKSLIIQKMVLDSKEYKDSKIIFLYSSANNEVKTDLIFNQAIADNKIVAFPKVQGKDMEFIKVQSLSDLKPGYFSILEPVSGEVINNPDLVITPGVAFDLKKNRVGYGKGFYDRYFNNHNAIYMGIAFDMQIVDNIPADAFDKPLDMIITDKGII